MATFSIVRAYRASEDVNVLRSVPGGAEAITTSGTSQASTTVAVADEYWHLAVTGGSVWVKTATAPVAAAGDQWLIPDGGFLDLEATAGHKVAVKDV